MATLKRPEILGLATIGAAKRAGVPSPELPKPVMHRLVQNRLAQPDDFGTVQITTRGAQHLRALERKRAVRKAGEIPAMRTWRTF